MTVPVAPHSHQCLVLSSFIFASLVWTTLVGLFIMKECWILLNAFPTSIKMIMWFLIFSFVAAAAAKSLQSCPTLCDPIDGSPPGSPVPGILQARTLEWVAISFSSAWKWKNKVKSLSCVRLLVTPWTAAHQAPPPMGFSRQEYWSGLPLPSQQNTTGYRQFYIFLTNTLHKIYLFRL